jgi:uncharacterized Zn-binding protein involved in type VI secretion
VSGGARELLLDDAQPAQVVVHDQEFHAHSAHGTLEYHVSPTIACGIAGQDADTVQVELPAVISVGDAINEPRYPSLKAIMGAKKKQLDTKGASDVGIEGDKVGEGGSRTAVLAVNDPPAKESGEIIEDENTGETVEKIVAWLDERKLLS